MISLRRLLLLVTLSWPLLSLLWLSAAQPQQLDTSGPEIKVMFSATDRDQNLVNKLTAQDLRIIENGVPQQIISVDQMTDRPVSLVILIDVSFSQERVLQAQKLAANSLVDSILRPDRDLAALATFTGTLSVDQKLTGDQALLRAAISRAEILAPPNYIGGGVVVGRFPPPSSGQTVGSTAIWDVIVETCKEVFPISNPNRRNAIVLFSDGEDMISKSKIAQAIRTAVEHDVSVYAIGMGDPDYNGVNEGALRKLAEQTGGRVYLSKKIKDLLPVLHEIAATLRNQYVLVYKPLTNRKATNKVRIEIANSALKDVRLLYPQWSK